MCKASLHIVMTLALAGAAAAQSTPNPGASHDYDLLLQGGHVIDPASHVDEVRDVAVKSGRVAAVEKGIPPAKARKVVDVTGLYVTPGLIDIHVHVGHGGAPLDWFEPGAASRVPPLGILPDSMLSSGVTTIVDAGSSGAKTFVREKHEAIDHSVVRVLAFLNIVAAGMNSGKEQDLSEMDPRLCAETVSKFRSVIVGVKTAHYWTEKPWVSEHPPWAAVDRAEECGRLAGVPVMFDFWPRPPERSYAELVLSKMRPGDIHTHVFAQQFPIIDANGKVNNILFQARQRGVIFDVGHGAASFWFRNAAPAVKQGFIPDSISTDLHTGNINGAVESMITTMSKFLAMGAPLEDLIRRSTVNPAREIGRPELGTLAPGSDADITVIELERGRFSYTDCGGAKLTGKVKLVNRMTVRAGRIVYNPTGLGAPEWEKAPKPYFTSPKLGSDPRAMVEDDESR
ncbi:MAG: amidohydrolase/deacetylase family metallohydrolase [Acidobacteria bacterium]|nr:MAG: amidohydrolase/deacetylase family metallohydrolase [Acidobacteriota bacterium]